MNRQKAINRLIQRLHEERPQGVFEDDHDGGCPCFEGIAHFPGGYWLRAEGHCWRVSRHIDDGYQDLDIETNLPRDDAEKIARVIQQELDKQDWYNPYRVTLKIYNDVICLQWPTVTDTVKEMSA